MSRPYDISPLVDVIDALLAPNGCPWDRAQTHESMRKHMLEEAYEVCDAIDRKDKENFREELGDVLYQVVFHSALAEEEGLFDLQAVIDEVADKMKSRHPHIYPPADGREVPLDWESIKNAEKAAKKQKTTLPECLPVLMKLEKLVGKLEKKGLSRADIFSFADSKSEKALLEAVYLYREEALPIELSAQGLANQLESRLVDME